MSLIRSLHIVQIGSDDSVFQNEAASDTRHRQYMYGEILSQKRPGSRLSYIVLTNRSGVSPISYENVVFIPVRSFRFMKNFLVWQALRKLHRQRPIDVISPQDVDSLGWIMPVFGKLYSVPTVAQIHYDLFSLHSMLDHMGPGIFGWIRKMLTFFFLRRFSAIRVVGQAVKSEIIQKGVHNNVEVIPVAVTLLGLTRKLNQHQLRVSRVLFVGRLSREKNLSQWLKVACLIKERNPAVEFDIVGDGPLLSRLKKESHDLGLAECVYFHGAVPYERLPDFYRSASVCLLTSFYEGFGRVLVEASAYGLPSIAPRMAGVEDIILDRETGILCRPDDSMEMANSALYLIESPAIRKAMGAAGEAYVSKTFAPQKLAEAWMDYLIKATPNGMTIPSLRPTLKRLWRQSSTTYSLLRGFEYESINGLTLKGRTLDVGGGARNSYYDKVVFDGGLDSINIDRSIKPTILADLNFPMPISNAQYDNIISLNTFEHIYHDEVAIREAFRVLKPRGSFHIIVPFLYIVHGSPFDYHRHPASWWSDYISSLGVPRENVIIEPLLWDPFSSGFAISEFQGSFRWLRKRLAMLPAVLVSLRWRGQERLPWLLGERQAVYALGYYIHGQK